MSEITITLPGGIKKKYPKGTTYYEISKEQKNQKMLF